MRTSHRQNNEIVCIGAMFSLYASCEYFNPRTRGNVRYINLNNRVVSGCLGSNEINNLAPTQGRTDKLDKGDEADRADRLKKAAFRPLLAVVAGAMTRHDWPSRDPGTWYGSEMWKKRRLHQLRREPLCHECLARGRVTTAVVADHHPPHGNSWQTFRYGPLRSLCLEHHNHSARFQQRRGFLKDIGVDGYPIDPAHPVYAFQKKTE
jgi:5-methylcytosine-specific restriction enzyme A